MPIIRQSLYEYFECTKDDPWSEGKLTPVRHPDAIEGKQHDGWPAGDYVDYECPNCGLKFQVELPQ